MNVGGTVYNDLNNSGLVDPLEGRQGRVVYVDLNNNQLREKYEPATTTDLQGNYLLSGVPQNKTLRLESIPGVIDVTTSQSSGLVQNLVANFRQTDVLSINVPNTSIEGGTLGATAMFSAPDATVADWQLAYSVYRQGTLVGGPTAINLSTVSQTFPLAHTPTDDGIYEFRITATKGPQSYTASSSNFVFTSAPDFSLPSTFQFVEGGAQLSRTISFTDGGDDAWRATISFGDGSPDQVIDISGSIRSFPLDHTYSDNGSYPLTIQLQDLEDGLNTTRTSLVNVTPLTALVNVFTTLTAVEGVAFNRTVDFLDGLDTWTIDIDWGDGSPIEQGSSTASLLNPNLRSIPLVHTYADNGSYPIKVTITDTEDLTPSVVANITANVANSTPSIPTPLVVTGTLAENSLVTLSASANDVLADRQTLVTQWDFDFDGTNFTLDATGPTVTYRLPDSGSRTIAARVIDKDGDISTITTTSFTVDNIAPTVSLGDAITISEGESIQFTGTDVASDQAGVNDPLAFAWRLLTSTGTVVFESSDSNYVRTIGNDGDYQLQVTVVDDDGGSTTTSIPIRVNNVTPTVSTSLLLALRQRRQRWSKGTYWRSTRSLMIPALKRHGPTCGKALLTTAKRLHRNQAL